MGDGKAASAHLMFYELRDALVSRGAGTYRIGLFLLHAHSSWNINFVTQFLSYHFVVHICGSVLLIGPAIARRNVIGLAFIDGVSLRIPTTLRQYSRGGFRCHYAQSTKTRLVFRQELLYNISMINRKLFFFDNSDVNSVSIPI